MLSVQLFVVALSAHLAAGQTCSAGRGCMKFMDFGTHCPTKASLMADGWTMTTGGAAYVDGCDTPGPTPDHNSYYFYADGVAQGKLEYTLNPPPGYLTYGEVKLQLGNWRVGCDLKVKLDGFIVPGGSITDAGIHEVPFTFTPGQVLSITEDQNCEARIFSISLAVEQYSAHPVYQKACEAQKYRNWIYHSVAEAENDCTLDTGCSGVYETTCGSHMDIWLCPNNFQQDPVDQVCQTSCMYFKLSQLRSYWNGPTKVYPDKDRHCCTLPATGTNTCASTGDPHICTFNTAKFATGHCEAYWNDYSSSGDYTYFENNFVEVQVRHEDSNCSPGHIAGISAVALELKNCDSGPKVLEWYSTFRDQTGAFSTTNPYVTRGLTQMGLMSPFVIDGFETPYWQVGEKLASLGCTDLCSFDGSSPSQFIVKFSGGSSLKVTGINGVSGCYAWDVGVYVDVTPQWTQAVYQPSGICTGNYNANVLPHWPAVQDRVRCGQQLLTMYTPDSTQLPPLGNPQAAVMCKNRRRLSESGRELRRLTAQGQGVDPVISACETNDSQLYHQAEAACDVDGNVDQACLFDICAGRATDFALTLGTAALAGAQLMKDTKAAHDAAPAFPVVTPAPIPGQYLTQDALDITVTTFGSMGDCQSGQNAQSSKHFARGITIGCENHEHSSIMTTCQTAGILHSVVYSEPNCDLGNGGRVGFYTVSLGECHEPYFGAASHIGQTMTWSGFCDLSVTEQPTSPPTPAPTMHLDASMSFYASQGDCQAGQNSLFGETLTIAPDTCAPTMFDTSGPGDPAVWTCESNGVLRKTGFNPADVKCQGQATADPMENFLVQIHSCFEITTGNWVKMGWSGYCDGNPTPMPTSKPSAPMTPMPTRQPTPAPTVLHPPTGKHKTRHPSAAPNGIDKLDDLTEENADWRKKVSEMKVVICGLVGCICGILLWLCFAKSGGACQPCSKTPCC